MIIVKVVYIGTYINSMSLVVFEIVLKIEKRN